MNFARKFPKQNVLTKLIKLRVVKQLNADLKRYTSDSVPFVDTFVTLHGVCWKHGGSWSELHLSGSRKGLDVKPAKCHTLITKKWFECPHVRLHSSLLLATWRRDFSGSFQTDWETLAWLESEFVRLRDTLSSFIFPSKPPPRAPPTL